MLFATGGNQCAAVRDAHAPCLLEVIGNPVEWRECPYWAEMMDPKIRKFHDGEKGDKK